MEIWQKNAIKNIVSALKSEKLSQRALAKKAKLNYQHFNAVMNGQRPITRQLVATVADHLNHDTDWFYVDHSLGGLSDDPANQKLLAKHLEKNRSRPTPEEYADLLRAYGNAGLRLRFEIRQKLGLEEVDYSDALDRAAEALQPQEKLQPKDKKSGQS
jgi:transcriptional regulator with XRE-family HTH domain